MSATSFDCNKAKTLVEQTICSNTELSSLDDQVATRYKEALQTTENKESVKTDQRKWLTARNNCKDVECLKAVYVNRISKLDRLPGPPGLPNTTEVAQAAPSATNIEALIKKGDLAGARSGIEQVIREKPNSAKAYYLYAQILHAQGQDEQARQALNMAEQLNPTMDFTNPNYLAKLKAELSMAGTTGAPADNHAENVPARVCSLTGTLPNNKEMRLKATITPLPPKEPDKIRIDYTRDEHNGAIIADLKNRKANQVTFSQDKIEVKEIPFPIANGPVVLIELINFAAGTNIENAQVQDNGCQKVALIIVSAMAAGKVLGYLDKNPSRL